MKVICGTISLMLCFILSRSSGAPVKSDFPQGARCGNKDTPQDAGQRRVKRFALEGTLWSKDNLTYTIYKYPANPDTLKKFTRKEIDRIIKEAFTTWSDETNLRFQKLDSWEADIQIGWEAGDHGDGDPFDGTPLHNNTVAHGFYPRRGGDLHFDDAETWAWKTENYRTENLLEVAIHEIGHVLGLSHSEDKKAFMFPYVHQDWQHKHTLSQDDVEAIQSLYGPKNDSRKGMVNIEICNVTGFEAVYGTKSGGASFFKGDRFWFTGDYHHINASMLGIDGFHGWTLPTPANAVVYFYNSFQTYTYFFKGNMVYEYSTQTWNLTVGYPKRLSDDNKFRYFPDNIDGAFALENEIFYVKNAQFGSGQTGILHSFPRPMFPPFDDVFINEHVLYFLKGDFLYYFADKDTEKPMKVFTVADIVNASNIESRIIDFKREWFGCP